MIILCKNPPRKVLVMDTVWLSARSNIEKVLTPQNFANWIKPIRFHSVRKDTPAP